jgi:orotate phosphoribosyltransferase
MDKTSQVLANILLQTGAVSINAKEPFVYTSGIKSPIYTDNRILLSFPQQRRIIVNLLAQRILEHNDLDQFDLIAGVATAGISWAALLADRFDKPMIYIRQATKGHGKEQQIEGILEKGNRTIVIEDLISTGGSIIEAAEVVKDLGGSVPECMALFTYELPQATAAFKKNNLSFQTLSKISDLLHVAIDDKIISREDRAAVDEWLSTRK